jgi:hypothetical protein
VAADIFISYAREDRAMAQHLAQALEQKGLTVWWDWDLIGGANYRAKIRDVIAEARKAIVLWSRHSVVSAFVIDEASEAKKLGKLIPILIDQSDLPFGFGDLHTITLHKPELDIEALIAAINDRAMPRPPAALVSRRRFGKAAAAAVALPCAVAVGGAAYWLYHLPSQGKAPAEKTAEAIPVPSSSRIALVIGNSNYRHLPPIPNAVRDAERVTGALEQRGFRVIKETNVTQDAMVRAVTDFESGLSIYGGLGLFYYAGSAVYIDGDDIMLPIDAAEDKERPRILNGVNLTQLLKEVQSRTTRKMKDNGAAVIYSASKGQLAADGPPGGNSPFTSAFLRALANADDELSDTFDRIRSDMEAASSQPQATKQIPLFEKTLARKIYLSRPERDSNAGASKILIFDSCRDNPFKMSVATK